MAAYRGCRAPHARSAQWQSHGPIQWVAILRRGTRPGGCVDRGIDHLGWRGVSNATPWAGRRLHFVGIGGGGMSGLARVARALGAEVSGSDRAPDSPYLRAAGIAVAAGHDAANVPDGAEVVVSSAIPPENPERVAARERGLRELHRA